MASDCGPSSLSHLLHSASFATRLVSGLALSMLLAESGLMLVRIVDSDVEGAVSMRRFGLACQIITT
jgi:hypothetical protein